MTGFTFRPAKRENVPLLLGVAGGTGSGKTMSALRLARGLADGQPFAFVDTENGRGKHYADLFPEMRHGEIHAPFRPDKYADAVQAGAADYPVVVVDSMSHEWAGDGGCLDWHDEIMGGDQKKNLQAWIQPKLAHKRMVTRLLQLQAHVILCFRAEPKVEAVREGGQVKIIPKPSLTGLDGWLPITEKMLPYELTASFLLMADQPGVPRPIKLQEQHRPMVPLDQPLTEDVGLQLGQWARGADQPVEAAGLTYEAFKERLGFYNIAPGTVAAIGGGMFPGRSATKLNDGERAELMRALLQQDSAPPPSPPDGAEHGGTDAGGGDDLGTVPTPPAATESTVPVQA